ncbi:MAG TPA: PaaI family thioesterase [Mycobacteriales bacterium]|nr:PaaI family thioesterase [Mycobacteriales bacterium]
MSEPAVSAELTALRDLVPFARLVGIEITAAEPHEVRARLDWHESRCTEGGALHGGALMALADTTGALCAYLNLPEGAGTTTVESKTNFLRAVREGYVDAVARPLHVGRTVIVVETELFDTDGRLVAKTTQTQAVLTPR